jgi:hypothetical protein
MGELTADQVLPHLLHDEVIERLDKIIALLQPSLTEADVRRIVQDELRHAALPPETILHIIHQVQSQIQSCHP